MGRAVLARAFHRCWGAHLSWDGHVSSRDEILLIRGHDNSFPRLQRSSLFSQSHELR